MENKLIYGKDVFEGLATLEDNSIDCVVTSPPYWGLRDYGTANWEGGTKECEHSINKKDADNKAVFKDRVTRGDRKKCLKCGAIRRDRQLGLEETPAQFIQTMTEVFSQVRRVLKPQGTCWINMGDSYAGAPGGFQGKNGQRFSRTFTAKTNHKKRSQYLKPKDLVGIPWMLAFALREDGWYLRQDIIWSKPNPMPESVKDRCTKAHEYIFLFTKSSKYYYDANAIKEPYTDTSYQRLAQNIENQKGSDRVPGKTNGNMKAVGKIPGGWHQGKQYQKMMGGSGTSFKGHSGYKKQNGELIGDGMRNKRSVWEMTTQPYPKAHFATFPLELPTICIKAGSPAGGIILDPFSGSGTTGEAAIGCGRRYIGIDLNKEYEALARERLGLFV